MSNSYLCAACAKHRRRPGGQTFITVNCPHCGKEYTTDASPHRICPACAIKLDACADCLIDLRQHVDANNMVKDGVSFEFYMAIKDNEPQLCSINANSGVSELQAYLLSGRKLRIAKFRAVEVKP